VVSDVTMDLTETADLFGSDDRIPAGFRYTPDFLTADEEHALVGHMPSLPSRNLSSRDFSSSAVSFLMVGGTTSTVAASSQLTRSLIFFCHYVNALRLSLKSVPRPSPSPRS
jgi:hypothetical protein